jgi:hypothetical protein
VFYCNLELENVPENYLSANPHPFKAVTSLPNVAPIASGSVTPLPHMARVRRASNSTNSGKIICSNITKHNAFR